jgi:hypothetical protein
MEGTLLIMKKKRSSRWGKEKHVDSLREGFGEDLLYICIIDYITHKELPKIQAHVPDNPPRNRNPRHTQELVGYRDFADSASLAGIGATS